MTDLTRVVVSGFGAISSAGCGRQRVAAAFRDSTLQLSEVDRTAGYHRDGGSLLAAVVGDVDLSAWLKPRAARRMSRPSRLAVAAAKMALEEAGVETGSDELAAAVVLSTAYGPSAFTEQILGQVFGQGPEAASPFLFAESVANAPAAQVALACRAVGPNLTVTQREAGPLIALARGATEVALGRASCGLVLAVDEFCALVHSVLDRFGALARRRGGDPEMARPFDRRRNGFLFAEGATVLVLEEEQAVRRRGGRVLARIRLCAGAFDPDAPRTSWSHDPRRLAGALARHLARAALAPEEIDCIVSGASGSRDGDRLEGLILKEVWGDSPLPPIVAPKAVSGEHGGALLAAAQLAVEGSPFGPTPGFVEIDPELGIVPHDGRPLPPPRRALITALAPGGAAAWVVLEQGDPG
ncbi:MAG: hypothetical protein GY856_14030 [bacterium]|nr:hypothetical protein [bacterium]